MKKGLFGCIENSCRSQIAEAFAKILGRDGVKVNYEVADKKIFDLSDSTSAVAKRSLEQKRKALKAG